MCLQVEAEDYACKAWYGGKSRDVYFHESHWAHIPKNNLQKRRLQIFSHLTIVWSLALETHCLDSTDSRAYDPVTTVLALKHI